MADNGSDSDGATSSSTSSSSTSSSTSSDSSSTSSVGDSSIGGNDSGGGNGDNSNNSTNDSNSDAPSTNSVSDTTTSTESQQTNDSLADAITASLNDAVASLSLSFNDPAEDASKASFGAMPSTLGEHAMDAAFGHMGKAGLSSLAVGLASKSADLGFDAGLNALTDPTSVLGTLAGFGKNALGLNTEAHGLASKVGGLVGSTVAGPIGAVVGNMVGTIAAELGLDAFQARDNEAARDAMENGIGPISGRATAAEMSDLGFAGFNMGLNDPSLADLDSYTAGVIGQAMTTANAAANLGDPTAGLSAPTASSISGMDTTSMQDSMSLSSQISNTLSNVATALNTASIAPDRSGEFGWGDSPSVSVSQDTSINDSFGDNIYSTDFSEVNGWLNYGLPVRAPAPVYRSSYWDGTQFVNMNDYRGFM